MNAEQICGFGFFLDYIEDVVIIAMTGSKVTSFPKTHERDIGV